MSNLDTSLHKTCFHCSSSVIWLPRPLFPFIKNDFVTVSLLLRSFLVRLQRSVTVHGATEGPVASFRSCVGTFNNRTSRCCSSALNGFVGPPVFLFLSTSEVFYGHTAHHTQHILPRYPKFLANGSLAL